MKFYQFNLGDYSSHTKHLSLLEDLAYRRMLDLYYTHERELDLDPQKVARLIGMRDNLTEVLAVLEEFFIKSETGWSNRGAEKVLGGYKAMVDGGKSGAQKRWGKVIDEHPNGDDIPPPSKPHTPPQENPNANHKPKNNTINQEPHENNAEENALKRIRSLFNMRESTPLDSKSRNAWRNGKTLAVEATEDEWKLLEWHHSQPILYQKRSISALLNDWNQALATARSEQQKSTNTSHEPIHRSEKRSREFAESINVPDL